EIKALENSSVPLEKSLPWLAGLVALGVAMEFWVIWHDHRNDWETWALWWGFGIARDPARPSIQKFLVEMASVFLVTIGIIGELWVGIEITSINGTLRNKGAELRSESDKLLVLVTHEAGSAKDSAEAAEVAATRAKGLADSIARKAEELQNSLTGLRK